MSQNNTSLFAELRARGLVAQVTNEEQVAELIDNGRATFYIGYDPTADSLTAGHMLALVFMRRMQLAGNRPIVVIGGGTTMIGDPSGRTDMRKMLTLEQIAANGERFKTQMSRLVDFSEGGAFTETISDSSEKGKAIMVNNADWLLKLNYVELLREVGAQFSVNRMLTADCYKNRMEKGLTFLEFNYMIMQSYDFYKIYQDYNCTMECGGDDQWSNILGGTELIRRKLGADAHGLTLTLLVDGNGVKMGKTAGNAVWLDPEKTSPYEFYQYWRNVADADVGRCLRMLTFAPLDEIAALEAGNPNAAKEILGYELTKMIHGEDEAKKALDTARALFSGSASAENMPSTTLTEGDLTDGSIKITELLVKIGFAPSNGEAKRLIQGGGVFVDDTKVERLDEVITAETLRGGVVIRKGKKSYNRVVMHNAL